jgi:hypothetical protein
MASKFQTNPFPVEKLARMKTLTVSAPAGDTIDIAYPYLKLVVQNGQLCFSYESEDGELLMPIARKSTIDQLYERSRNEA